jgi:hypothetical protein
MKQALLRVAGVKKLSSDLREVISKALSE